MRGGAGAGLAHVLWLGGPPGAGKTTVAEALARRHGLRLYSADTRTWDHVDRLRAAGSAAARAWHEQPPEERYARGDLLTLSLHAERGPLVLDDLRALPTDPLIVAEGSVLPAAAADPARALWLLPASVLQATRLAVRGIAGRRAEMERQLRGTIAAEAAAHGVPTLEVGDDRDLLPAIEAHFAAALAGARPGDREALAREAAEAQAAQLAGYRARPWTARVENAGSRSTQG